MSSSSAVKEGETAKAYKEAGKETTGQAVSDTIKGATGILERAARKTAEGAALLQTVTEKELAEKARARPVEKRERERAATGGGKTAPGEAVFKTNEGMAETPEQATKEVTGGPTQPEGMREKGPLGKTSAARREKLDEEKTAIREERRRLEEAKTVIREERQKLSMEITKAGQEPGCEKKKEPQARKELFPGREEGFTGIIPSRCWRRRAGPNLRRLDATGQNRREPDFEEPELPQVGWGRTGLLAPEEESQVLIVLFDEMRQLQGESLADWHSHLLEIFRRTFPLKDADSSREGLHLRRQFLMGLWDERVGAAAWSQNPANYHDALRAARREEALLQIREGNQGPPGAEHDPRSRLRGRPICCQLCGYANHELEDCFHLDRIIDYTEEEGMARTSRELFWHKRRLNLERAVRRRKPLCLKCGKAPREGPTGPEENQAASCPGRAIRGKGGDVDAGLLPRKGEKATPDGVVTNMEELGRAVEELFGAEDHGDEELVETEEEGSGSDWDVIDKILHAAAVRRAKTQASMRKQRKANRGAIRGTIARPWGHSSDWPPQADMQEPEGDTVRPSAPPLALMQESARAYPKTSGRPRPTPPDPPFCPRSSSPPWRERAASPGRTGRGGRRC